MRGLVIAGWRCGSARSFQPSMNARIAVMSSLTDQKLSRWTACRSAIENQLLTMFIHDACVGVQCTLTLNQPLIDRGVLVRGMEANYQVRRLLQLCPREGSNLRHTV